MFANRIELKVSDFFIARRVKRRGRSLTMKYFILSIATVCMLSISGGASRQFRAPQSEAIDQSFDVDGIERTALIYPGAKPAPETGAPLVKIGRASCRERV